MRSQRELITNFTTGNMEEFLSLAQRTINILCTPYAAIVGVVLLSIVSYYLYVVATNQKDPVKLFKTLKGLPFGEAVFMLAIAHAAPYSGTFL